MKRLERYYENINSKITPDELVERVAAVGSEKKEKKHRRSFKFAGVIAAAAAVLSLGITAGANGISFMDVFKDLFGERAEGLEENVVEGAEITADTMENLDLRLIAAASDSHSVLYVVEVTAKNGFRLGENHIGDARADLDFSINFEETDNTGGITGGSNGGIKMIEGDENRAVVSIYETASFDITGMNTVLSIWEYTEEKPADMDISEIHHYAYFDDDGNEVYRYRNTEREWQVKFTAEGKSEEYELDNGVTLSLSPISAVFSGTGRVPVSAYNVLTLVTKDGDELDFRYPGSVFIGSSQFASQSFTFLEPVNIDEVKEIRINNRTVIEF